MKTKYILAVQIVIEGDNLKEAVANMDKGEIISLTANKTPGQPKENINRKPEIQRSSMPDRPLSLRNPRP